MTNKRAVMTPGALLLLLMLTCNPVSAMQVASLPSVPATMVAKESGYVVYTSAAVSSKPVTVSAAISFTDGWDSSSNKPVVNLVGLAFQPATEPDALSLSWQQDTTGWFPKWKMVWGGDLFQEVGAISGGRPQVSSVSPQSGHTYAATLSYDHTTGAASALVIDSATDEVVFASGASARTFQGALHLSAGVSGLSQPDEPAIELANLRLASIYLPLGDEWTVGAKAADSFVPGWGFAGTDDWHVQITSPESAASNGRYEIALQHNGNVTKLRDVVPSTTERLAQLPKAALPLGESELSIAYIVDGKVWLHEKSKIVVGSVDLQFQQLEHDMGSNAVKGVLRANSKDSIAALPMQVEAIVYAKQWDQASRGYKNSEVTRQIVYSDKLNVGGLWGEREIPLSFTAPNVPGLWEATLRVTAQTDVLVNTHDATLSFNTYQQATIEAGEPYTIAILPDTQFYANVSSQNHIFLRQAQWIAENAAEKNIGLVLHMGDITHLNRADEWQVAQNSMHALDGVVPYILAIGNHDTFVGTKWTTGASPINEYFPADTFPHLRGSFESERIDSAYYTFRFNSIDYLIMTLEFSPRDAVLVWANEVVAAHPNHRVIIITHAYLTASGGRITEANLPPGTNDSHTIWDRFVRKHKNILMVLAGHYPADRVSYSIDVGDNRNVVYNLLFDYQSEENGGNGWLGLLEFMPDNTINVSAYSPYLDQYKTGRDRYGFTGRYVIPIGKLPISKP